MTTVRGKMSGLRTWMCGALALTGCDGPVGMDGSVGMGEPIGQGDPVDPDSVEAAFVPAPVPDPEPPGEAGQPVYVFLFTHTEDPFNHERSDERFERTLPMVEALAADYPETHPEWTVQFQGSDAASIGERHGDGGVVGLLRDAASTGRVHFGYHGQHDPTYLNRPQKLLAEGDDIGTIATAFDDWVSCARDIGTGDCEDEGEGGIVAIQEVFGEVVLASGLAAGDEGTGPFESGGGQWAIRRRAPDLRLAFGFSDHAPEVPDFEMLVTTLMTILAPSGETSGGVFWADDALRVNDGDWQIDVHLSGIEDGPRALASRVGTIDTTRPRILNGGIASKWLYAETSPTQYGYAHPDAPELPTGELRGDAEIERAYATMEAGLRWIAGTFMPAHPGSRFIGPDELLALAAPDDYFEVTADELDRVARWALTHWTGRPPSYLSDGTEFYSLRDAIGLLARALAVRRPPSSQTMTRFYGPEEALDAAAAVRLSASEIASLAATIAGVATANVDLDAWTPTPPNLLPSSFAVGERTVTTAQALHALATAYAARYAGTPVRFVRVPATTAMPETYDLYRSLGCIACEGTSWSTKPARLRSLSE